MKHITALDIAHYLLFLEEMNPMKLNKLCYLCFGWYSVLNEEKLFEDKIEAWQYGPVVPSVYYHFKEYGAGNINLDNYTKDIEKNDKILNDEKKVMLDFVHRSYPYTALQLSTITHKKGTPWHQTWTEEDNGKEIPFKLIKPHFKNLYKSLKNEKTNQGGE